MLLTSEKFRSKDSPRGKNSKTAFWDLVDVSCHSPCFLLTFLQTELPHSKGMLKRRTVLTQKVDFVQNFIESVNNDSTGIDNVDVQVFLPGYMTGTKQWSMEPLSAVWSGVLPEDEDTEIDVFETTDGRKFAEIASDSSIEDLTCLRTRFRVMHSSA